MLNLLRYRKVAKNDTISGEAMYQRYFQAAAPILEQFGAEVLMDGQPLMTLVGREDEEWDRMLIVRYSSLRQFLGMARSPEFLDISQQRLAALENHRLIIIGE